MCGRKGPLSKPRLQLQTHNTNSREQIKLHLKHVRLLAPTLLLESDLMGLHT